MEEVGEKRTEPGINQYDYWFARMQRNGSMYYYIFWYDSDWDVHGREIYNMTEKKNLTEDDTLSITAKIELIKATEGLKNRVK